MSTVIRSNISKNNPYYISKHRYLELKHFCLQYYELKKTYRDLLLTVPDGFDPTSHIGMHLASLSRRIELIETCDDPYIFKSITEGYSYPYIRGVMNAPYGRNMYYEMYRRFMFDLSNIRE